MWCLEVWSLGHGEAGSGANMQWHEEEEDGLTSEARMLVRGKRLGAKAKDKNPKVKHIHKNMPITHMPSGPAEEAATCRLGRPLQGRLGRSGQIEGEDSVRN
jgi:hypothetical protein